MEPTAIVSNSLQNLYLFIINFDILIGLFVIWAVWHRRQLPGAILFICTIFSAVVVSVAYLGISISITPNIGLWWVRLKFLGLSVLPGLFLLFCLEFTGHRQWIDTKVLVALLIVPVIVQISLAIDPDSGLFFRNWTLIHLEIISVEKQQSAAVYWLYAAYFYTLMIANIGIVIRYLAQSGISHRRQLQIIVFGSVIASVVGALSLGITPTPVSSVPIAVMIALLLIAWLVFSQGLFDVMPVAYDTVFGSMRDAVFILDSLDQIVQINHQAELLINKSQRDIIGQLLRSIPFGHNILGSAEYPRPEIFEFNHDSRIYEVSFSRLQTAQGSVVGRLIVLHDITQSKAAEEQVRHSDERLRYLLTKTPVIFMNFSASQIPGDLQPYVSDTVLRITGYPPEVFQDRKTWLAKIHPDDLQADAEQMAASNNDLRSHEYRFLHANGTYRWFHSEEHLIRDDVGNPLEYVGYAIDITERKEMEQSVTSNEAKFRAFVEQSSDGIIILDDTGRIIEWNPAQERLSQLKRNDVLGTFSWDVQYRLIPPEIRTQSRFEALKTRTLDSLKNDESSLFKKPVDAELYMSDGSSRYIQQKIFPIRMDTGYIVGSISRDVTERKQAEIRAFDLALEKERVRLLTRFIEKAGHEFRTPLSVIGLAAFNMARAESPEKRQSKLAAIENQVARVTKLVEMLLKMTGLENTAEKQLTAVNINAIVKSVYQDLSKRYRGHSSQLPEVRLDLLDLPNFPPVVVNAIDMMDAIEQILDNAYRFTPADGTITVSTGVKVRKEDYSTANEGTNYVWLKVNNTGVVISEAHLPHIFETFWRQDEAHTTPGFGLGLPIAQKIVTLSGGTLSVESNIRQGTTFIITLPMSVKNGDTTE